MLLVFRSDLSTTHHFCTSQLEAPETLSKGFSGQRVGLNKDQAEEPGVHTGSAALINNWQHWWLNILVALFLGWDNTETVSQNHPVGLGHKVLQGSQPFAAPSLLCFISLSPTNATWAHPCYPPNRSTFTFVQDLKELNLIYNPSSERWNFDIGIGNDSLV